MKLIIKQLVFLLISFAVFTVIFSASAKLFFLNPSRIDTNEVNKTLFDSESKLFMLHRNILWNKESKALILGSSISRKGLRPLLLESDKIEFHNLSLSASNITQMNQQVRVLLKEMDAVGMKNITFIYGITFQSFVENKNCWKNGATRFDLAKKQFYLFDGKRGEFRARVKPQFFFIQKELVTPFLMIDKLYGQIAHYPEKIRNRLVKIVKGDGWLGDNFFVKLDDRKMSQDQQDKAFLFWEKYFNSETETLGDEQFQALKNVVNEIIENGCRIEIVSLPVPKWLSDRMGHYKDYENKIGKIKNWLSEKEMAGFIDLTDMNDNLDFYDSSHPKPKVVSKWNNRLLLELKKRESIKKSE